MESMVFDDLTPISVPVKIGEKDYILREAGEGAIVTWRDSQTKAARFSQDGRVSPGAIAGSEPLLVSMCLFEIVKDKERKVPLDVINTWRPRIVKQLFIKAVEINDLREMETEKQLVDRIAADTKKLKALRTAKNGQTEEVDTIDTLA